MLRSQITHRVWALSIALLLCAKAAPAEEANYPETEPGRHAREYFPAFNGGESAMRAYIQAHVSAADLAKRGVDARLGVWREMRGEHGRLTPRQVVASGDDFVEVLVKSEHGGSLRIRFLCQSEAPHALVALRVEGGDDAEDAPAAAPGDAPKSDEELVARFAAELDSLARAGEFSGVARLDKGDRTLFEKAYGLASRRDGTPNRLDTRFNLGSINKSFTQVAIEQLAQADKLSLDDTISRFLPDYPKANGDRITVRMLIAHRGGVPDVLENPALWENPSAVRTMADWYALIRERPLEFEPGTKQQYSNGGYVLLGEIITRVSGQDYYDYIREHIYAPAGMTRSDHYPNDERVEGLAIGYTRRGEGGMRAGGSPSARGGEAKRSDDGLVENTRLGRGSPAGGGFSTAGDMVRYARALRSGKLLDAERTRGFLGEVPGLGIAGGSPGCNALLEIEGPYTLVVLANVDPPAAERFARSVGRWIRPAGDAGGKGERKVVRAGGGH